MVCVGYGGFNVKWMVFLLVGSSCGFTILVFLFYEAPNLVLYGS